MSSFLNVLVPGTALVVVLSGEALSQEKPVLQPLPGRIPLQSAPVVAPDGTSATRLPAVPDARQNSIAASAGEFVNRVSFWTEDQTPADFLEMAGKHTKARWRIMYRPQPPSPTADRVKAAFTLGSLIGETFLIWEAGDSQRFRNNNQDIVTYCKMLGIGEKMMPRLMAQAKMAESDEWKELRQEIVDGHVELMRLLNEQKDPDLAVLVDLGAWMRSLEIVSQLVVEIPDVDKRPLCIGSPALLAQLREDFSALTDGTRRSRYIQPVITVLTELEKVWNDRNTGPPTQGMVTRTHEQLRDVMAALTLK